MRMSALQPIFFCRDKLTGIIGMCNLNINAKIMFGSFNEISPISSVSIYTPYPWENEHGKKSVSGFGIMDIGPGCGCLQYIAIFIGYYIAFYALDFLIAINSFPGTGKSGSGALTVYSPYSRIRGLSSFTSEYSEKSVLKFREGIHCAQRLK